MLKVTCTGFVFSCLFGFSSMWSPMKDMGRIYFSGDLHGSPTINVFSVDVSGDLRRHTYFEGSRDLSISVDESHNLYFSSNRVFHEKQRALRQSTLYRRGRPQEFNVFRLFGDTVENADSLKAQPVAADFQENEILPSVSPDGKRVSWVQSVKGEDNQIREILKIKNLTSQEVITVDQDHLISGANWSPDSTTLIYATYSYSASAATSAQLKLFDVYAGRPIVLMEAPRRDTQIDIPQWSPNGRKISFIFHPLRRDGVRVLYVFDRLTHELIQVSPDYIDAQSPVSWSPDSSKVAYGGLVDYKEYWSDEMRRKRYEGSAELFLSDLKGNTQQLTDGNNEIHTRPVFSPGGERIAYMYASEFPAKVTELRVMDLKSKAEKTLYERVSGKSHLVWQP